MKERIARALGGALLCSGVILIFCGALSSLATAAEEYPPEELKAVALYRLPAFVEWPAESLTDAHSEFTLCLLGGSPLLSALAYYEGKPAKQRMLRLKRLADASDLSACQLLFVPEDKTLDADARKSLASRGGCLTVGETHAFTKSGGMVGLVIRRRRLQVEVNLREVRMAGLKVSSDLLALATIVDGH